MDKDNNNTRVENTDKVSPKHVISAEISLEIIDHNDDGKPKISKKRRAFIKQKNRRMCLRIARFFLLLAIIIPFVASFYVSCFFSGLCLVLSLCFYGGFMHFSTPEIDGYTPWYYGAL